MADGLNHARAMRVNEIMTDFRNIQNYIASIRASPSAEEYNEDGYALLRRCVADAQNLLSQPFNSQNCSRGDDEQIKAQLRRIITDAAVRRFKAQKIYLRITAALRWINTRAAIVQGQRPHAGHAPALQQIRSALRSVLLPPPPYDGNSALTSTQEVSSITDQRVELSLRSSDSEQGKWLDEDPGLSTLQRMSGNGNGR